MAQIAHRTTLEWRQSACHEFWQWRAPLPTVGLPSPARSTRDDNSSGNTIVSAGREGSLPSPLSTSKTNTLPQRHYICTDLPPRAPELNLILMTKLSRDAQNMAYVSVHSPKPLHGKYMYFDTAPLLVHLHQQQPGYPHTNLTTLYVHHRYWVLV